MEQPTKRADYSRYIIDPETGEEIQVHDEFGREIPDDVPMAPPLGYSKPLSMFDQMRAQIRAEHTRLRQMELEEIAESAEQANDFEVDEDMENQPSLYEEKFDPVDYEVRQRLRQAEFRASVEGAVNKLPDQQKELLSGDTLRYEEPVQPGGEYVNPGRSPQDGSRGKNKSVKDKNPSNPGVLPSSTGSGNKSDPED